VVRNEDARPASQNIPHVHTDSSKHFNITFRWLASVVGRQPGPWARIERQLTNEATVLENSYGSAWHTPAPTLISWEWLSCLSPLLPNSDPRAEMAKKNYEAYRTYVGK
jgi:hypothetical protein